MSSNCNTLKSYESKTGEKASVLGIAMANIALASVILGSMYFVSDFQKKHMAQASGGEAVAESSIAAPDSLANRAVNRVKALTETRQITIKNEAPMDVVLPEGVTPEAETIEIEVEIPAETDVVPLKTSEAEAKAYIFRRESSNRPEAENKYGCKGLGQDCNGRLVVECPNWKTDRKCQEVFFGKYVSRRYGSWQAAKTFWDARVPINGRDVGNWY